ncbi:RtcB family protein [Desulfobacterales bacterium HSG17]|nr:RtcB family protein [Desulfobacterales bacterium HSG17]
MTELKKIDKYRWELPKTGNMLVPGIIYTNKSMIKAIIKEGALKQIANVASLPGILKNSLAMPDVHQGYGFTIGGVAAFDWKEGIISPGGVGYDINCGVRLATTNLEENDIKPKLADLVNDLYRNIPSGVGSKGSINLSGQDGKKVLKKGSQWAVEQGFGEDSDIEFTEERGCLPDAAPSEISEKAMKRGKNQLGTLGSGNHFLEIGIVDEIYDEKTARTFGLYKDQVTIMLHTGSRGLGYQICDDFLAFMKKHVKKLPFELPDRQLSFAMIQSEQGQRYFRASELMPSCCDTCF